ncbi:MAG: hypothetical protein ACMZ7B_11015 [Balneola sp.]
MNDLQIKVKKEYDDLTPEEQKQYLQESFDFHKKVAHYHLFMANNFSQQLGYHDEEEIEKVFAAENSEKSSDV